MATSRKIVLTGGAGLVGQNLILSLKEKGHDRTASIVFPACGFKWHPLDVAHVIGVAPPVLTSYLGHRHLSFARIPQ